MKKYAKLERPIIFIGTGRSGTTIISEIFDRHPDLAFPSNYQDRYPKHSKVNLIRSLFDNPLWRTFGQKPQLNKLSSGNRYILKPVEAYNMWNYLTGDDLDFSRDFLFEKYPSEDRIDFIRSYFNKMVLYQNKKRLTFKITGPSRISYLTKIFPDAIFINLKRNLIPTINSFLKVDFWQTRGANQLWWTGAYSEDEKKWAIKNSDNPTLLTAFQIKKIIQITEVEVNRYQPKYLEVYYEDFVADPEKELNRIINFTDLPPFEIANQLRSVKIHNRNKKDTDYFEQDELNKIYQIIK
ncbi:sulfotransferase [Pricia sp. S334]|uniref:Sulfotransferase n=1 Tax=Pricia mediterranea TaxID=3076079 RepID=A0ABU3L9Y3_9FLAO|nr:sulfotransferase [Pricia sp. S334]MDT7830203.1 sulfotransferase [Pricia sp. S334]